MRPGRAPAPVKRDFVTPSAAVGLLSCALQLAFRDDPGLGDAPGTPALYIGTAAHEVLEQAAGGALSGPEEIRSAWDAAIAGQVARAAEDPRTSGWPRDPRRWPFYALKRARTVRLATALSRFSHGPGDGAGRPAAVRLEQAGEAFGGRLRGRIDVVRLGPPKVIEDYKTGAIADPGTGALKDAYRAQMLLYAVIEHERDGVWPEHAVLVPVQGAPVEVGIDPGEATQLADDAMAALDRYLATGSGESVWELASPGPAACGRCPFAVHCQPFWDACTGDWAAAGVTAAAGAVTSVSRSGDLVAFVLDSEAGTHAGRLAVSGAHLSQAGLVEPGDVVTVTAFVPRGSAAATASYATRIERAGKAPSG